MENVKLVLETDYEKYGNSSGQQIDMLSIAVCGSDFNDIEDNSRDWLDQYEQYTLDEYDYETDFLAQLTKAEAKLFIENAELYQERLARFTEELKEKVQDGTLDESHALAVAVQEANDRGYKDLRHEWLYGDYREPGLLRDASRKYAIDLSYDDKTDTLTFDIEEGELADLIEYQGVENTPEAVGAYMANMIETGAYEERNKRKARNEENRKNWETRKRIADERAAEAEAKRVAKLKAIS